MSLVFPNRKQNRPGSFSHASEFLLPLFLKNPLKNVNSLSPLRFHHGRKCVRLTHTHSHARSTPPSLHLGRDCADFASPEWRSSGGKSAVCAARACPGVRARRGGGSTAGRCNSSGTVLTPVEPPLKGGGLLMFNVDIEPAPRG